MVAVARSEKNRTFDGAKVRQLRKAAPLSLETLAEKAGVSGADLSRYERGLVVPSVNVAARIADALGVSVDALMKGARG